MIAGMKFFIKNDTTYVTLIKKISVIPKMSRFRCKCRIETHEMTLDKYFGNGKRDIKNIDLLE